MKQGGIKLEKHHITSFDGTRIYYESMGEGPVICACNGIGVSTFFWKYLADYFSRTHRVILWDYRCHGKSGPAPDYDSLSMTDNARDLAAVLDHAGVGSALLTGHSMGVQTIFEFYRHYPERCAGLIPVLGAYGKPMDTFMGTSLISRLFPFGYYATFLFPGLTRNFTQALYKLIFLQPVAFNGARLIKFVNSQHMKSRDLKPYLDHIKTLDLRAFMSMAKHMQENSALDLLPKMKIPVLIVAGEEDLFTPWKISKKMQTLIPEAELLTIPRGSHAALVEQPELMNLRIEKFIRERLLDSEWGMPEKKSAGKASRKKAASKKAPAKTKTTVKKATVKKAPAKKKSAEKAKPKKGKAPQKKAAASGAAKKKQPPKKTDQ